MKKRILSLVLAVLMLLSVLPATALAAEPVAPQADNVVTVTQNGVTVKKEAEWIDENNGKAKITFTLTGGTMTSKDIPYTDIVLVIDKSGSMGKYGKMEKAKTAAEGFVNQFFGDKADQGYADKVRIAVVSYSNSATTNVELTNKKESLTSAINGIQADGGTHIQAGIRSAQQILDADKRENVKKLIVVLSDGEPTYSYRFGVTGATYTGCQEDWFSGNCWGGSLTSYGTLVATDVTIGDGYNNRDNLNFQTNVKGSATCNRGKTHEFSGAYYTDGTFSESYWRSYTNHVAGTIWEANQAKAKGTEIFSIGFGLGNNENAINTMKGVATDADHYKAADSDNISFVFNTIATTITKAIAKNAMLTDPLGTGFTLTTTEGGTTYTKDVGDLSGTETIEFEIQYNTANPAAGDTLPTNSGATLTYKDSNGADQTIRIPNPKLENLARTVTYVDENGNAYTDDAHKAARYWKGTEVTQAAAPERNGYTFAGWEKIAGDVTVADGKFTIGSENVTFKATWEQSDEEINYTIRKEWVGQTGDSVTFKIQRAGDSSYEHDDVVLTKDNATSDANIWETTISLPKWNYDQGNATEAQYNVTETKVNDKDVLDGRVPLVENGITKGDWTSEALTNANGAKNTFAAAQTYSVTFAWDGDAPTSATLPNAVTGLYSGQWAYGPAGYEDVDEAKGDVPGKWTFNGWKNGDQTVNERDLITVRGSNITVTGSWTFTPYTYEVTYAYTSTENPTDAATAPDPVTGLEYNSTYTVADVPTTTDTSKDGVPGVWSFSGWKNGEDVVSGDVTIVESLHLTGSWTFEAYDKLTLSYEFVSKDGSSMPSDADTLKPASQQAYPNQSVSVNNPGTPTDTSRVWTFSGWYTDEACTEEYESDTITLTQDTTLYGYWTSNAKKARVTINKYLMNKDASEYELQCSDMYDREIGSEFVLTDDDKIYSDYPLDESKSRVEKFIVSADESENIVNLYFYRVPTLSVSKSVDRTSDFGVGDTLTYTITVKNGLYGLNLTNVKLTDVFDGCGTPLFENGEATFENGTATINIGELKVGKSVTFTATYKVETDDAGNRITNTVTVTATTSTGENITEEATAIADPNAIETYTAVFNIKKELVNKHSKDFEGETFEFETYYYVDGDKKVLKDYKDRETITIKIDPVAEGETESAQTFMQFSLTPEEYAELPKETVKTGEYLEVDGEFVPVSQSVPYVWVREIPGSTTDMHYDTTAKKVYLLEMSPISMMSEREAQYDRRSLMGYVDPSTRDSVVTFTNTYAYIKYEEPVKVGPQLNRDDHVAYIMGYPDGTVQPEGEITRAEACTIFFRLLTDSSRDEYFSKTNDYSDVNAGDWFNNAISTLSNAGIVTGYNDGTFRPNQPITRGEMAKIIANFANLKHGDKTFTDLAGHWSKSYVELAAGNGWIAGYPDGSFRPDQKITRAETVTMINRVLERVPAKESRLLSRSIMLTFPDNNPGDWYYIAIQEASNSHEYQRSVYETTGDEMWTKLIDNVDWTKLEK